MGTSTVAISTAQKESIWRERIARQSASGKTIAAFCHDENVGKSTVSYWCRRLGANKSPLMKPATASTPFVDLGPIKAMRSAAGAGGERDTEESSTGIDVRLELGGGVVLHIARH